MEKKQNEPRFAMVPLSQLVVPTRDVRTRRSEVFLEKLVSDIRNGKLIEPLVVRPLCDSVLNCQRYEVVSGVTRFLALKRCSVDEAPCYIHNVDDAEALLLSLKSAIMRRSYDPIGVARAIKFLQTEKKMKLTDIAHELGYKSRSWVTKLNALNKLPDNVKARVSRGELTVEQAYSFVSRNYQYSPSFDEELYTRQKRLKCGICGEVFSISELPKIRICPLCFDRLERKAHKRKAEPKQKKLS